jgi:uncharacterized protein YceK
MKKQTLILSLALMTSGCAHTALEGSDTPMAYQSTLLQYRIMTEGLPLPASLSHAENQQKTDGFKWMSIIERTVAGATLPLSAVVETLFLPVTYAYTGYINGFQLDDYPLAPERTRMLSRADQPQSEPPTETQTDVQTAPANP